jgi:hypothetical protein
MTFVELAKNCQYLYVILT